jgi:hypothetical protein
MIIHICKNIILGYFQDIGRYENLSSLNIAQYVPI